MRQFLSRRLFILLTGAALLMPAAMTGAEGDRRRRPTAQELWAKTELYFGTSRPSGTVSDAEFLQFVEYEVTPRFPEGLTLLTGFGQFRSSTGEIVKERSQVLILLYPIQSADANEKIQAIREAYKQAFQQESVLRVDSVAMVSF